MSVGNELNTDKNEDWLTTAAEDGLNIADDVNKFGNRDSNICGILEVNMLDAGDAGGDAGVGGVTAVFVRPFYFSIYSWKNS